MLIDPEANNPGDDAPAAAQPDPLSSLRAAAPQIGALRRRMWQHGFRPVAVQTPVPGDPRSGKAPTGKGWPARARHDPPEAATAPVDKGALNTGSLADGLRVVDIDVDAPELAARVNTLAAQRFGPTITRGRHNSPRRLLVYRAAQGEPGIKKLDGALGGIEVLGRGQQFVTVGLHGSGAWLQWGDDRGPWNTYRDVLLSITEAQIDDFLSECAVLLGKIENGRNGRLNQNGLTIAGVKPGRAARGLDVLGEMGVGGPPPKHSAETESELKAALRHIPADDREVWLFVGMALHSLTVAQGWGDSPRYIWDDWSRSCPSKFNEAGQERVWGSFKPRPAGEGRAIGTIYELAQKKGWNGPAPNSMAASPDAPRLGVMPAIAQPADATPGGHPRLSETDIANGRRLISMHGADLRYASEWGAWVIWDADRGVWVRDKTDEIIRRAKSVAPAIMFETINLDGNERTARAKWARDSAMDAKINAMIRQAQAEPGVTISALEFDADPWLLGVQNGVIDLRRGTCGAFRPGRREDMITKRAGVAFDPHAPCPNWLRFLDIIFGGDSEVVAYVQRVCGYVLTGDVSAEALFLMFGTGANGKSTFRETLHDLLGDYASVAPATLLIEVQKQRGATPEIADLLGRRMVAINETNEGDRLAEGRIKAITSTDTITARSLYAAPVTFRPTHKLLVTTNHRPLVRGADDGIWRRIHAIPFTVKIENRQLEFRARFLVPESAGILNWALEGLRQFHARGLDQPPQLRDAADGYRKDMDAVGQFLDEQCAMDPAAWTPRRTLYDAYVLWAQGASGKPMGPRAFYERMNSREGMQSVKNSEWGYKGVTLQRVGGLSLPTR